VINRDVALGRQVLAATLGTSERNGFGLGCDFTTPAFEDERYAKR
jgi:hypothetical protein